MLVLLQQREFPERVRAHPDRIAHAAGREKIESK
jgi:hypothetical protein